MLLAPAAGAQVVINQAALDQLAGISPPVVTAPPVIRQLPRKASYRHVPPRRIGGARLAAPRLASSRLTAPAPAIPALPNPALPPAPVLPKATVPEKVEPAQPVVARPVIPAPSVVAPAPAAPKPLPPAFISFAAGNGDLPGNGQAALKPFCGHTGAITIDAYAAADPADPSSAARLSLSRAFAIRDALTACGTASSNIIPRANGANSKTPDAAEISAAP